MTELKWLIDYLDKAIEDYDATIEKRKDSMKEYCAGIDLVNGDLKFIRKWLMNCEHTDYRGGMTYETRNTR